MSVWTGLDLFIKSITSLMSLVVSYRQEIYKGEGMDYKRISTGFVPVCRNCGKSLGVVCIDEDDMADYIDKNGQLCDRCDKNNLEKAASKMAESAAQKFVKIVACMVYENKTVADRETLAHIGNGTSWASFINRTYRYGYRHCRLKHGDTETYCFFEKNGNKFRLTVNAVKH